MVKNASLLLIYLCNLVLPVGGSILLVNFMCSSELIFWVKIIGTNDALKWDKLLGKKYVGAFWYSQVISDLFPLLPN